MRGVKLKAKYYIINNFIFRACKIELQIKKTHHYYYRYYYHYCHEFKNRITILLRVLFNSGRIAEFDTYNFKSVFLYFCFTSRLSSPFDCMKNKNNQVALNTALKKVLFVGVN